METPPKKPAPPEVKNVYDIARLQKALAKPVPYVRPSIRRR